MRRQQTLNGKTKTVGETVGTRMTASEAMDVVLKDRLFYEESGGGVTFSGGEPLMQLPFLLEMLERCHRHRIHTAVDTSGYAPDKDFQAVAGKADLLLFDLKTTDNHKHLEYTGVALDSIMNNLFSLQGNGPELIARIPVIPGFNDNKQQMEAFADILLQLQTTVQRVDLLPYHRLGRQKYNALGMQQPEPNAPGITTEAIQSFMDVFTAAGFHAKKGG